MYLLIFGNPHDNYKELKIPFAAENDIHAEHKANEILDIWFDGNEDFIEGSIINNSIKLFNLKEIKIVRD